MVIAQTSTFALGRYTVHVRPRFDSPYWAVYIVYRGDRLIGKSFSRPDIGCCKWLELQASAERTVYATRRSLGRVYSIPSRGSRSPFATAKNGTKR